MALWDSLVNWAAGVDPSLQAGGDAADKQLLLLNQANVKKGLWTQAQADSANAAIDANLADNTPSATAGQIEQAAADGAKTGLVNAINSPGDLLSWIAGQLTAKTYFWVILIVCGFLVISFWPVITTAINGLTKKK